MGSEWSEETFADYKLRLNRKHNCLTAWELIELLGSGYFSKGMNHQTLSMGISEVFQELIMDVLKQVRRHIDLMCTIETVTYSPPLLSHLHSFSLFFHSGEI